MSNAPPSVESVNRADLDSVFSSYIVKGAWNKADVLLVTLAEDRFAVKDYARKSLPIRWSGAMQLARETRAYERLVGVPGIPAYFGALDKHAIILEYVGGIRLPKYHHKHGGVPRVVERLEALLESVHSRGIIHGDLRSRDNLLVTPAGEIFLIDFSSATVFDMGSWAGRVLFPRLRRAEQRALLKWKVVLAPEELTEGDIASHRKFKRFRRWWPFNRKQDLPETRGKKPLL